MQRVYVKVTSDFDSKGYMQPRLITWTDGRVFKIDNVKDFRPAGSDTNNFFCDCYTVVIKGEVKYLFLKKRMHIMLAGSGVVSLNVRRHKAGE